MTIPISNYVASFARPGAGDAQSTITHDSAAADGVHDQVEFFVGRTAVVSEIVDPKAVGIWLVTGLRGVGKTWLLMKLKHAFELPEYQRKYGPVVVSSVVLRTSADPLAYMLMSQVLKSKHRRRWVLPRVPTVRISTQDEAGSLINALSGLVALLSLGIALLATIGLRTGIVVFLLVSLLGMLVIYKTQLANSRDVIIGCSRALRRNVKVVFLIDEADKSADDVRVFADTVYKLSPGSRDHRYVVVVAGSPENVARWYGNGARHFANPTLHDFTCDDVDAFLKIAFERHNVELLEDDRENAWALMAHELYKWTGGYPPWVTQCALRYVSQTAALESSQRTANVAARIAAAATEVIKKVATSSGRPSFSNVFVLDQLYKDADTVIAHVNSDTAADGNWCSRCEEGFKTDDDLARHFKNVLGPKSNDAARSLAEELIRQGVILRTDSLLRFRGGRMNRSILCLKRDARVNAF